MTQCWVGNFTKNTEPDEAHCGFVHRHGLRLYSYECVEIADDTRDELYASVCTAVTGSTVMQRKYDMAEVQERDTVHL